MPSKRVVRVNNPPARWGVVAICMGIIVVCGMALMMSGGSRQEGRRIVSSPPTSISGQEAVTVVAGSKEIARVAQILNNKEKVVKNSPVAVIADEDEKVEQHLAAVGMSLRGGHSITIR